MRNVLVCVWLTLPFWVDAAGKEARHRYAWGIGLLQGGLFICISTLSLSKGARLVCGPK